MSLEVVGGHIQLICSCSLRSWLPLCIREIQWIQYTEIFSKDQHQRLRTGDRSTGVGFKIRACVEIRPSNMRQKEAIAKSVSNWKEVESDVFSVSPNNLCFSQCLLMIRKETLAAGARVVPAVTPRTWGIFHQSWLWPKSQMCPMPLLIWEMFERNPKWEKRTRHRKRTSFNLLQYCEQHREYTHTGGDVAWAHIAIYAMETHMKKGETKQAGQHRNLFLHRTPSRNEDVILNSSVIILSFIIFKFCLLSLQFRFLVWRPRMTWCELCLQENFSLSL